MIEQKVWVEKMPESCWECPCFKNDINFPCGLSDGTQDYFRDEIDGVNCPLQSIKEHDNELDDDSQCIAELKTKLEQEKTKIKDFAIEKLEKIKDFFVKEDEDGYIDVTKDIFEVVEYINTLITKLKGEISNDNI